MLFKDIEIDISGIKPRVILIGVDAVLIHSLMAIGVRITRINPNPKVTQDFSQIPKDLAELLKVRINTGLEDFEEMEGRCETTLDEQLFFYPGGMVFDAQLGGCLKCNFSIIERALESKGAKHNLKFKNILIRIEDTLLAALKTKVVT